MILVVCQIVIAVNVGGVNILTSEDVRGELLVEGPTKFLVDFSKYIGKFQVNDPKAYSRKLVNKQDCVKL